MGHAYPLARTVDAALAARAGTARTRREAETLAGEDELVETLETEWLTPPPQARDALLKRAETGVGEGFIQRYEDADGAPVLAVTYWKIIDRPAPKKKAKPAAKANTDAAAGAEDHTDDLYFRGGRTKAKGRGRRKRRPPDPNQLDLFGGPDQRGYETPDPGNPAVRIVDEEGDGATFGGPAAEDER